MFAKTLKGRALLCGIVIAAAFSGGAQADLIPQSALVSSNYYYTDLIGGGLGQNIVTTGGGNAANLGEVTGRNDDGYMQLNLGFSVSFFGKTYSSLFINNNGNVSFESGIEAYIPDGPTGAMAPVISPFFSDVDTRNALSGVVRYRNDIADQLIVTWDNVGYFSGHGVPLDSFQLILRGVNYSVPTGEGSIGFFYKDMGWEVTNTSQTAAVGFGDGAGNSKVIAGSNEPGLYSVLSNHHVWFDPNLAPVPDPGNQVPEPGMFSLIGLGFVGLAARRGRRSMA